MVRASVRNLFPGLVLVAPVPHVSLWARQHCPGARISPRHQAVTPGEAGPGWGRRWDCVGCARRKWLGASAVAMCTLKGSAQRLLLGSLLGESRWDFLFAPFPAPSPSSCLGPFGLQPRQRLSNTLPSRFDAWCSHFGAQHPNFGAQRPSPSAQHSRQRKGLGRSLRISNPRAEQACTGCCQGNDGSGSLTGSGVISRMVFLMRQVSSRREGAVGAEPCRGQKPLE